MDFIRNSQGGAKIVLILLSLALIGGGIFGFGYGELLKQKAEAVIALQLQGIATSGWETYHDDEFGFEVKHPKEWTVITKEANKEAGVKGLSISSGGLSFNIFMTTNDKESMRLLKGLLETPIRNVLEIDYTSYSIQGHFNVSGLTAVMYYADRAQFLYNNQIFDFPSLGGGRSILFIMPIRTAASHNPNKTKAKSHGPIILSTIF